MKKYIKIIAFRVLGHPGRVLRRLRQIAEVGDIIVLNLHRVTPPDGSAYAGMTPELFRDILAFLTRHCHITTFGAAIPARDGRPTVVLSFDDGYYDFVEYAWPIMNEFGVVSNMNIIPKSVETGLPPFNVMIQDYIGKVSQKDFLRLCENVKNIDWRATPATISKQLKFLPMEEQKKISSQMQGEMLSTDGFAATRMMSLEDVRSAAEIHEIGAHSMEHASMSTETDEYVRKDAYACTNWFEEKLGFKPTIYAFPNGAATPSQVQVVHDAGYNSVLLVGNDFALGANGVVNRFNFTPGTFHEARFRLAGELRQIKGSKQ